MNQTIKQDNSAADRTPEPRSGAPVSSRRRSPRTAAPSRFIRDLHAGRFGSREYLLFIPSDLRRARLPLVVMLHGCHQDGEDFAIATRMNQYAQQHRCFVAYPVQPAQANGARCWNWYEAAHQQRDQGEPASIAELTGHLLGRHPIASSAVFIAGFSAGGAMAATVAVMYSELYAALGIHSGVPHGAARDFMSALIAMQHGTYASQAAHPMHARIPTIVFHGDEDGTVHSTHAAQFLPKTPAGTSADPRIQHQETVARHGGRYGYTRTVQFDRHQRIFSEHWLVHGGGHAWYGGDAAGTYVDPNGPDAAEEMMRFFIARKR